ncbi:MAG: DUF1573 domain-containing protein [Chitinispirillaceae bacterium]|nr:DUF1573 domain-containing protein [Chitinispirillaceae bacterium]
MIRAIAITAAMLFAAAVSPHAAPKIEFDTKVFRCDTIMEDKTEKISAVFKLKNTGDQPLRIESVRPGCGCTNVKFDSVIKPGKSSKISAEVNLKGYKAGNISKGITVITNAANEKEVRLTITTTIVSPVECSDVAINFGGTDTVKTRTVTLASKKHDLQLTEVYFKQTTRDNSPGWQNDFRLPLTYTLKPLDSVRDDGARVFSLELIGPKVETTISGEIVMKTNHSEKPELRIHAYLVKN